MQVDSKSIDGVAIGAAGLPSIVQITNVSLSFDRCRLLVLTASVGIFFTDEKLCFSAPLRDDSLPDKAVVIVGNLLWQSKPSPRSAIGLFSATPLVGTEHIAWGALT